MLFVFFILTLGLFGKFIPTKTHKVRVTLDYFTVCKKTYNLAVLPSGARHYIASVHISKFLDIEKFLLLSPAELQSFKFPKTLKKLFRYI